MKKRISIIAFAMMISVLTLACKPAINEIDKETQSKEKITTESTTSTQEQETGSEDGTGQADENAGGEAALPSDNGGVYTEQAVISGNNSNSSAYYGNGVENAIWYVINNYTNGSMSSFEKCKAVHDYLVNTVDYDGSDQSTCHEAEGALVNHRAVCDGYSKAFMLIMQNLGYQCQLVYGYAGENHA